MVTVRNLFTVRGFTTFYSYIKLIRERGRWYYKLTMKICLLLFLLFSFLTFFPLLVTPTSQLLCGNLSLKCILSLRSWQSSHELSLIQPTLLDTYKHGGTKIRWQKQGREGGGCIDKHWTISLKKKKITGPSSNIKNQCYWFTYRCVNRMLFYKKYIFSTSVKFQQLYW